MNHRQLAIRPLTYPILALCVVLYCSAPNFNIFFFKELSNVIKSDEH
jgi:hypothetical protein